MHTNTSKAVLAPLADAVSSLIVIVSDAETEGTPMPNLSPLAAGVEAQIANLVGVGRKIEAQPSADAQLKADMPRACADVTKAAQLLVSSTGDLVTDPYSASGRRDLLESVKGILSATAQVLSVFDDAEVRKILNACSLLRTFLTSIAKGSPPPEGTQAYVQTIAQASQTIVVLAQLTNKRVAELLYLVLQTRLRAAIGSITKESPVLINACKLSLTNPGSEAAKQSIVDTCDRLTDAVGEIEIVVQFTTEDEGHAVVGVGDYGKVSKALREEILPKVVRALGGGVMEENDRLEVQKAVESHLKATAAIVDHAHDVGEKVRDSVQRAQINEICQEIEQAQKTLPSLAAKSIQNLSNDDADAREQHSQAQLATRQNIDTLNDRTTALQTALNRAVISDAGSIIGNISSRDAKGTVINRIHAAASVGDPHPLTESLPAFAAETTALEHIVTEAMEKISASDPQTTQELRIARDRIKGLSTAYIGAAKMLAENPADVLTKEHYAGVAKAWEEAVGEIRRVVIGQEGVFEAEELISGSKSGFEHHARSLATVVAQGNVIATHEHAALLVSSAQQFIAVAQKEVEGTADPAYREELEGKIHVIQSGIPDLLNSATLLLGLHDAYPLDAASELASIVSHLTTSLTDFTSFLRAHKGAPGDDLTARPPPLTITTSTAERRGSTDTIDASEDNIGAELRQRAQEMTDAMDAVTMRDRAAAYKSSLWRSAASLDVVAEADDESDDGGDLIVNAPQPLLLSSEEAAAAPIKAAAQELLVASSHFSAAQNPIITAITHMSASLSSLSTHHTNLRLSPHPSTKKEFIAAAGQIGVEAANVAKAAGVVVGVCPDKRLRATLLGTLDRVQTLGQQLRIVAAVKASAPGDRDQDRLLIACSNNLMNAVKLSLQDCESASLRVPPHVLEQIGVRFRRQVHRSKQFGS
ncbi:Vinculin/alpha-catenin [Fimicolochytrium jonesii]|uniref:Vinculin/alpha-catenin n=1 Tax=Fimicolochytrium jonesii TaxID=1396493 RepID=UPI0022FE3497|nr:Vinculin/alpha-catenin [Fimicolochytrium jonesii]KAI8818931.1 Vinculin/alpha-catenin [Fimicolochytrium jonesii]